MARTTGYLEIMLPDITETPNFQARHKGGYDERHSIQKKRSDLCKLFKVLKSQFTMQHGHFCHFVDILEY